MSQESSKPWAPGRGQKPVDLRTRFFSRIKEDPETGCHLWTGYIMPDGGYGFIRRGGRGSKGVLAHRLALEFAGIEINKERIIHSCGRPHCVRIEHLIVEPPLLPLKHRFYNSFKLAEGDDCYEWIGDKKDNGYGTITDEVTGKTLFAHRLAVEFCGLPIPPGKSILHICDNPSCVRPDHLRIGTRQENQADMARKGRGHKGSLPYGVKRTTSGFMARCGKDYLGHFRTVDEAARVAADAKLRRYGPPPEPRGSLAKKENY